MTDKPIINGVGMPAALWLNEFGSQVWHAFDEIPYHVGSSLHGKTWRDVDVRLILDDAAYAAMGFGEPQRAHHNGRWVAMCMAFAALGKQMTGLPIDFQIQQRSHANAEFKDHPRSALGVVELRMAGRDDDAVKMRSLRANLSDDADLEKEVIRAGDWNQGLMMYLARLREQANSK